jgi:hypothetical protein
VECCDTLFISKFDGLQKHVGHQKAKFAHPKVHVREYFMNFKNQYVKKKKGSIIQQVVNDACLTKKCKICLICCNIPFVEARATDDKFESMKDFFQLHSNAQSSLELTQVRFFLLDYGRMYA